MSYMDGRELKKKKKESDLCYYLNFTRVMNWIKTVLLIYNQVAVDHSLNKD
jgi:hypothetical protein